ncbi:putative outer membrane colicin Js receptor [Actinobacillus ureae]|uniref:TonB-dependent receptor domain-containing protein n=1 Tax=Actinobacillus ureae TaxID=723 RepID=UPI000E12520C|nr:TonB-dependent receptor [Actinobacillus ureae]SUT88177.1 putative outer membrane colicin Js receptor [Actinobacillus ureae]SUU50040.1 putative outer membrane colicin Js receptor [Actinobacillus ureae]
MKLNRLSPFFIGGFAGISSLASMATEQNLTLDPVYVLEKNQTNANFESYSKAGAASSRDIGENAMQNLDSVVRSIAGAYTQIDPGQGAVSVNIRNITGLGRVNMMVDGVPQTQLGTSANGGGKFHEGNGPMSQFGALIDQNFLTRVDVSKGHSDGAAGVNALIGSANFKTIDAEDVLLENRKIGALTKLNIGSNGLGRNGMLAVAAKDNFAQSGSLSGLFALSKHKLSQNYKRGDGSSSEQTNYLSGLDQQPRSYLAKIALKPEQNSELKVSRRVYNNNIAGREIDSYTNALEAKYNAHPWLNVHLLASNSRTSQVYNQGATLWTLNDAATLNRSNTFDIHNNAKFDFGHSNLDLALGFSLFNNKYVRHLPLNENNNSGAVANSAFAPQGKQKIKSFYWNTALEAGIFTLKAGASHSHYRLTGDKPECDTDDAIYCLPSWHLNINRKYSSADPSVNLSAKVTAWFEPFIEYAETTRAPNVQEMFDTNRNGLSVNPFLRPESAKTTQAGFNITQDKLFTGNDMLGLKAVYFNSHITDYIFKESFYGCGNRLCNNLNAADGSLQAQLYVNAPNKVKSKGWEVELNYDAGQFFTNFSYTRSATTQPTSVGAIIFGGFGTESYTVQPKDHATLELGTRLLEKKLTLATTFKYTGKANRVHIEGVDSDGKVLIERLPKIPLIVDFYANYKLNRHVTLKAGIQNLMNKNYLDALNSYNSSTHEDYDDDTGLYKFSNTVRGRTYTAGAEIRF